MIQQLYAANGVDTDLELATFDADHDINVEQAVARLREQWAVRKSIHVADAYGWALYKSGDCAQADVYAREAMRLGTADALILFHAGRIADCAGDEPRGRALLAEALERNPHFSIRYAPVARQILQGRTQAKAGG